MLSTLVTLFLLNNQPIVNAYSATYLPSTVPNVTEQGEAGYNICGSGSSQDSLCQTAYVNSIDDFCLWAPPEPGANSTIGETERFEVAWCTKAGYGTRLIPDGTLTGVHFVQTPDFVQITGIGDLTKLNIPAGDAGGELDPHGADGNGNPIGGIVFTNAFTGSFVQAHEWSSFIGAQQFCFRVCKDASNAWLYCNHVYDEMGCAWNYPGNYLAGFDTCAGDSGEFPGVNNGTTFKQGDATTPVAHAAPATSDCTTLTALTTNGVSTSVAAVSSTVSSTSTSATATVTSGATSAGSATSKSAAAASTQSPSSGAEKRMSFGIVGIVTIIGTLLIL